MTQSKPTPIQVGDKFKTDSGTVYEVIGTKPGGKIELIDRENTRFTDRWSRDVRKWEAIHG